MTGIVVLSLAGFLAEEFIGSRLAHLLGHALGWLVFLAFSTELAWMLSLTRFRARYLVRNWLDIVVIVFSAAGLVGFGTQWAVLVRLSRLGLVGLLLVRGAGLGGRLLRKGGLPYTLVFGLVMLLLSGFGLFWLEPTVATYGEGLWLAFVTGTTIGYGDFVPTTTGARYFAALIAVVGVATMSMVTASIAALLVGEDERRQGLEMRDDIRGMRQDLASLISEEERRVLRELRTDMAEVRQELAGLRDAMADLRRDVGGPPPDGGPGAGPGAG
jgi:voltage-gated potassium channel